MSIQSLVSDAMASTQYLPTAEVTVTTEELKDEYKNEVLAFLEERPIHTVAMAGFIRDNGLASPLNRGTFYGCRNSEGRLEGVALIGHATLIDARTERAMQEFALVAQTAAKTYMIMGEQHMIEGFWNYYADEGRNMRRACRELLFETCKAVEATEEITGLRLATLDDIELILPVHAEMAEAESGVNPLVIDPEGFRARCARRIEKGRVWVVVEDSQLVFKADIVADTPGVIYMEGVWVCPSDRSAGTGRRCLRQLCRDLLTRTKSVCVLANEENERAHSFYRMCNFKLRSVYDTIFLDQQS
jgi:predicted GNAT family acetyltransferase